MITRTSNTSLQAHLTAQLSLALRMRKKGSIAEELKKKKKVVAEDYEKGLEYYSSNHQILLVGEGDFSFSLSLARCFGSASNIVASSLDPYGMSLFSFIITFFCALLLS